MSSDELSELREYANASPESKLLALRSELRLRISIINGYSRLIQLKIERGELETLPPDFKSWIDKIADSSAEMDEIIEILTTRKEA